MYSQRERERERERNRVCTVREYDVMCDVTAVSRAEVRTSNSSSSVLSSFLLFSSLLFSSHLHDTHYGGFDGYCSVLLHPFHVVTLLQTRHGDTDFTHGTADQARKKENVKEREGRERERKGRVFY